jgi:hypothetical protein
MVVAADPADPAGDEVSVARILVIGSQDISLTMTFCCSGVSVAMYLSSVVESLQVGLSCAHQRLA